MFELSIQESKPTPDFTGTDQYQVVLNLNGEVQDPRFLQFLEKVGRETLDLFSTADFLLLDHIHREHRVPDQFQNRLQSLVEKGVVERFGRGRGVKYILSRRYYKMVDEKVGSNISSAAGITKWLMKRAPTRARKGWIVKQTKPCS